ncbi:uncharacterized protein LOC127376993 isoform X2 [Dicentrarchus labrax]|uniref:uncharacterized protein LOC127376993 isoform X2 n=1 Tax=Dicentrarchus labrax TaxID=13489 RepID=UPI0021F68647|nr:uncharacterized protein LOC127376993 isoform X2 [Dicentrarchus labrax]
MHNWQENEIKELLTIRGSEAIRNQITGTVKDSVVYNRMTKLLAERGVYRSHMQVISKLKALRKQYAKYHQQKTRCGSDRVDWPFYDQCHRVFGNAPVGNPGKRHRSPTPPPAPSLSLSLSPPHLPPPPHPPPEPPGLSEEHQEVVVGLWDDVDDREINKHLGPVEVEDDEEQLEPISATYTIPSKKRKTTVMEQVSTLVSATVAQLREMDASMQAQEDARLQRLMDHEKEMQNNLMNQLEAMHERISRENHERHLELVDRILSRFPSPSEPSCP